MGVKKDLSTSSGICWPHCVVTRCPVLPWMVPDLRAVSQGLCIVFEAGFLFHI